MFWMSVVGVVFIMAGLVFFIKPEWIWRLTEQWKSCRADEPSDLYRLSTKFGGIIIFLVGIAAVVIPFILPFIPD